MTGSKWSQTYLRLVRREDELCNATSIFKRNLAKIKSFIKISFAFSKYNISFSILIYA